jgi:hypothetical protein
MRSLQNYHSRFKKASILKVRGQGTGEKDEGVGFRVEREKHVTVLI